MQFLEEGSAASYNACITLKRSTISCPRFFSIESKVKKEINEKLEFNENLCPKQALKFKNSELQMGMPCNKGNKFYQTFS